MRKPKRTVSVVCVCVVVAASCVPGSSGDPLEDGSLELAIAKLRESAERVGDAGDPHESERAFDFVDRAKSRLRRAARYGGGRLRRASIAALSSRVEGRRRAAGLVLQSLPTDARLLAAMRASSDVREWAWARFSDEDFADRVPAIRDESIEASAAELRALFERVRASLTRLFTRTPEQLSKLKEEAADNYRGYATPRLTKPWELVEDCVARRVDLTGDGEPDWCIAAHVITMPDFHGDR